MTLPSPSQAARISRRICPGYRVIIHCGGCMLNEREMKYRLACAADAGIPMTNYGTAIAHMSGILNRSLQPLL